MVRKMAEENMLAPSPPLPPDPSPATPLQPKVQQFQEPYLANQQKQPTPITPPKQPNLRIVDSLRSAAGPSRVPPVLHQPQPIKDAVNNAFDNSPVTNQLDPDFIKQVTEQVIKNLAAAGAAPPPSAPPQQTQFAPPPPPQQASNVGAPRSPTQSPTDSMPRRFTPPTPERNREVRDEREYSSSSPEPPPSDSGSSFSQRSRESIRSSESQRSRDTPRPFKPDSTSRMRRSTTSTRRGTGSDEERQTRKDSGSDSTARDKTPFRKNSRESETSYDDTSRNRAPPTASPEPEETTLEKIWQPLFDNGNPTMRLSQFLRGLALHLIDDYEPKCTLVVTPAKMLRFFNETKVDDEHYPWDIIFGGKMTHGSISMMYRKLLCQHHLVQNQNHEPPSIPALTPHGFEWFMTCLIQAHPDVEFERLAKAVMNMPISNADNKTERFPKELSRRLLPAEGNIQAVQRLVSSLNHEPYLVGSLKGFLSMPPPPTSAPPPPSSLPERERKPYSQSSQQSNAFDDEDLDGPPVQIERERKPYTAREGTGKVPWSDEGRPNTSQYKPESGTRTTRTNSAMPAPSVYGSNSGPSEPTNIPPRNVHRMSMGQGIPPPTMSGGYPKPGRGRSSPPPPRNPYARSEPMEVGSMPNSQYGSNLHPTHSREQYSGDTDQDELRRYQSRSRTGRSDTASTNPNEDDTNGGRGYPIPNRGVPIGSGYEYGSGSAGGPSGPIPVGSFPSRRPMGASSNDDRRRSMYVSPTMGTLAGDGGTDGYGSSAGMNGGPSYPPQQSYGSSVQH